MPTVPVMKYRNDNACESSSGVEHHLAKVRVAGSNPVFRSSLKKHPSIPKRIKTLDLKLFFHLTMLEWWNGRHEGLKILWAVMPVRVQVPPRVHKTLLIF